MTTFLRLLSVVVIAAICQDAWSQFPGGSDFRRRIMERMDANGNGRLDPGEVSERAQGFIERMAGGPIDLRRSVSIESILSGNAGRTQNNTRSSAPKQEDPYPVLARFGESRRFGFGIDPGLLNGRIVDLEKRYESRVLENVQRSMERYDKDGNGVLEHEEWSTMRWRDDPRQSDLDQDGVLTQAEMAERIASGQDSGSGRGRRSSSSRRGDSERDSRRGGDRFGRSRSGDDNRRSRGRDRGGERDRFSVRDGRSSMFGGGMFGGGPFGGRRGDTGRGGRGGEDGGRGMFGGRGDRGGGRAAMLTAMIGRMDRDGDGTINPDEVDGRFRGMAERIFERMGLDPTKPISLEEVRKRAEGRSDEQSGRRRRRQSKEEKPKDAYRVEGSSRFGGRSTYSVGEGPELPQGLPSWWSRRDRDRDGNVTMAEFLNGSSSNRQIDEFLDYDFNDDGVITPGEGKAAEAEKK